MKKLLGFIDIPISFFATVGIYYLLRGNIESIKIVSNFMYLNIQILLGIVMFKMVKNQKLNTIDKAIFHQQQKVSKPIDSIADTEQAVEELHKKIKKGGKIMEKIKLFFDKFGSLIVSLSAIVVGLLSYAGVFDSFVTIFYKNDVARGKAVLGAVLVIAGAIVAYAGNSNTKAENENIKIVLGKESKVKTPEQIQAEKNKKIAITELAKATKELKAFEIKNAKRIDILAYKKTVGTLIGDEAKELNDLVGERTYLNSQIEVNERFAK